MLNRIKEKLTFTDIVFLLSVVFVGGFNEHISCLLSCGLLASLFFKFLSKKCLTVKINLLSVSVFAVSLFYGLTGFWAIDSGMAFIGFLKFLPISLYMLSLWQEDKKSEILSVLPYFAAVLVVISVIGVQLAPLKAFFVVAGRFSGFFQYPNTFALFLLICELLLLKKSSLKLFDYISVVILIGGLLYTGSRTVFVLFFVSNFFMLLLIANKRVKITILLITVISVVAVGGVMLIFKDNAIINRYLNFNFGASTFIGRILYFVDALPLLLRYPFGMGYMGYFYMQGSIQTGIYNVVYVHNDFLQLFLDIGWVPALLFMAGVVTFFFKKTVKMTDKLIVGTFCLHTLFDFNLQFVAMFFLFIMLTDTEGSKSIVLKKGAVVMPITVVAFAVNICMATSLIFAHYGLTDVANFIYPFNTRSNLLVMEQEPDLQQANKLADRILKQNKTYFAPYSIKAKYSYSVGDFVGVIENKRMVFEQYPFKHSEFREYCTMLINAIAVFDRQGDTASVEICKQEIISAYLKFKENETRLSELGSKIDEQPVLNFSSSIMQYIETLMEEQVTQN